MKYVLVFVYFIFTFFYVTSHSMAEAATATQTLSISIPEVNLLNIPATVVVNLSLGDDGYYSGNGEFSYSITANTPSATEKKQITARVIEPNFGATGYLVITMREPLKQSIQTTVFQSGETIEKMVVGNISNVAEKDIAVSIALKKLSMESVKSYIDMETLHVAYPVKINYTLSY